MKDEFTTDETVTAVVGILACVIVVFVLGFYSGRATAQSQNLFCSAKAEVAEAMVRDMATTDFRIEHYLNESQREIAITAAKCSVEKQDIKACYIRRCMEQNT